MITDQIVLITALLMPLLILIFIFGVIHWELCFPPDWYMGILTLVLFITIIFTNLT